MARLWVTGLLLPAGGGGERRGHEGELGAPGPSRPVGLPVPDDFGLRGRGVRCRGREAWGSRDLPQGRVLGEAACSVWKQLQVKVAPGVGPSPAGPFDPSAPCCSHYPAAPGVAVLGGLGASFSRSFLSLTAGCVT